MFFILLEKKANHTKLKLLFTQWSFQYVRHTVRENSGLL